MELDFCVTHLQQLYDAINDFQMESRGALDAMETFHQIKSKWQAIAQGNFSLEIHKKLSRMPAAYAKRAHEAFKKCAETLVRKIDNLFEKTIKAPAIKVSQALVALCPSNLQSEKMVPIATFSQSCCLPRPPSSLRLSRLLTPGNGSDI